MSDEIIKVPDIGSGSAEVIEICVSPGDAIDAEDSLIVLESDKATMEVPAPKAGKIVDIILKVGDSVCEGDDLLKMALNTADAPAKPETETEVAVPPAPVATPTPAAAKAAIEPVTVPDIGAENVPVIEVCVSVGDSVAEEDSLIVLESDKATMEVPSPKAGVIKAIKVKEGDSLSQGDLIAELEVAGAAEPESAAKSLPAQASPPAEPEAAKASAPVIETSAASVNPVALEQGNRHVHAGPAVRKLAREFGVELALVKGTGPRGRIIKEDVQTFVKTRLKASSQVSESAGAAGTGIPPVPAVDFSQWGEIEDKPLTRPRAIAAQNFQRSWLNVPHVTQFDEADITELEAFRQSQKAAAEARGTKLTPLPFILKASAYVLKELPQFCSSLSPDGKSLIQKHYINIGVAVDTPDGLLVPVIKNVDKKGLWELAQECIELAGKARNKTLKPAEMQGGCFTISSLGAIGGTAFTPIVNAPEVAILGLSKSAMKPVWNGKEFAPRLSLPLSLSYDHRAINGAEAARFTAMLSVVLGDIRKLLL